MYHHPRGTHLHKRAGVRAGKSENDPYIYYKYIYTINFNSIEATEPAFNCFAATETAISDHKRHNYILIFSIQLKQKYLYRVNVHLCQYELLRD